MPSDPHGDKTLIEDTALTGGSERASAEDAEAAIPPVDPTPGEIEDLPFEERYKIRSLLGQGGMGEVVLASDRRIGRHVAIKLIRGEVERNPEVRARFVREARLQGQLEHPAIVPVYEVGLARGGQIYFTMKRVRGLTLSQLIAGIREHDAEIEARYSLPKLLAIFVDVCLAIEFAHKKRVVHRDLKPGNVMIGDFGEVYVIDWGLAGLREASVQPGTSDRVSGGTPGYMAPEQRSSLENPDPRSDVYALGAILFEVLTLEKLDPNPRFPHPGATAPMPDPRPSVRAPERNIAPELEWACVRATKIDPASRFASARELADAIQRYLDGDRDLELRKKLAQEHLTKAEELVVRALEKRPKTEESDRAAAMKELGSAITLDPKSELAGRLIARLLQEPPSAMPEAARAQAEAQHQRSRRTAARGGVIGTLAIFSLAPFILWMGVKDAVPLIIAAAALFLMSSSSLYASAEPRTLTDFGRNRTYLFGMIIVVALTRLVGPLIVAPAIASAMTLPFLLNARKKSERIAFVVIPMLAFLVPLALEELGLLSRSYQVIDGAFCVLPNATSFPLGATIALLCASAILVLVTAAVMVLRLHNTLRETQERLMLYSWHLSQIAPGAAPFGAEK
jgi:eukaryotic-like serine/threonine-protein kinase